MISIDELLEKVEVAESMPPNLWRAYCPVHDDHQGDLIIGINQDDGHIMVGCRDGCNIEDVYKALGVVRADLCPDPRKRLQTITARELQQKEFPPTHFVVDKLVPHGVAILAAASKIGKSWFVLDMCLNVAAGERFLNRETTQGECLYLALEDTQRRLQDRMNKILDGKQAPEGFAYATSSHDIKNGLLEELEVQLEEHPDTSLIVIDTLEKIRPAASGKDSAYSKDYKDIGALKEFADKHDICIFLVHHIRKMTDDNDSFNRISGTNGLMGAADTSLIIEKESRDADEAKLTVTGRDVEQESIMIQFNKQSYRWENIGNANWLLEQRARLAYDENPIVMTIKSLLHDSPNIWSGTASDLLNACRKHSGEMVAPNARSLTTKIQKLKPELQRYDRIEYSDKRNGSGARVHTFQYGDCQHWTDVTGDELLPWEQIDLADANSKNMTQLTQTQENG